MRSRQRFAFAIIAGYALLFLASLVIIKDLKINTKNEMFYDHDGADYKLARYIEQEYGSGNNLVVAITGENLITKTGLQYLREVTGLIRSHPVTLRVTDITSVNDPLLFTGTDRDSLDQIIDNPEHLEIFKNNLLNNNLYTGGLIAADGKTAGLVVEIKTGAADGAMEDLLDRINNEFSGRGYTLRIAGFPVDSISFTKYITSDQQKYSPIIFATFALLLLLFYRSFRGVLYPLLIIAVSLALTLAIFARTGHFLTPLSSLLIPVILTVSMADVIHIINRYVYLNKDLSRVYADMWKPCLITSLTVAAGFLSLDVFNVPALIEFGVFAAAGTMIAYVATMTLLFALLAVFDFPEKRLQLELAPALTLNLAGGVFRCRRYILLLIAAAFLISIPFIREIDVNTNFISYLREKDDLYKDNRFINDNLTGINSIDILVRYNHEDVSDDRELLGQVDRFQQYLRGLDQITNVIGPADFYVKLLAAQSLTIESATAEDIAFSKGIIADYSREAYAQYHNKSGEDRIHVRVKAMKSSETVRLVGEIRNYAAGLFPPEVRVEPAGEVILFNRIAESLVRTQVSSIVLTVAVVIGFMGLAYRSLKVSFIAMLPNIIPVFIAFACMGLLHIELSLSTAMVAAVTIGLIVDNEVHFIHEYYEGMKAGLDSITAVHQCFQKAGTASLISTVVLLSGFAAGFISNFKPTYYFTLLMVISITMAMVCDIFVTPLMLYLLDYRKSA